LFFVFCWLFIGAVSSIDTSLTVQFSEGLKYSEENPIARMILANDGWKVARFVGLKMFGTICVLGILICLFKRNYNQGLVITITLALFQALLLTYLLL
jgi:hypothetical protein